MTPLVSIIVPIYNAQNYLSQCIESIQSQAYSNIEVILVDDGSTDDSLAVCNKYALEDSRITVIHKNNGGVSSARNTGLDSCHGKWVGFVDSDDLPKSLMYDTMITLVENHKGDMVMGGYEKKSLDDSVTISLPYNGCIENQDIKKIIYSMSFWNGYLNHQQLPSLYGSVWPNLYNVDIIRSNKLRFPDNIKIGEDLLFNLSYLSHVSKIVMINKPLYEYNVCFESATRKRNPFLWREYSRLLENVNSILMSMYEGEAELLYNVHKQYLNYAINVIEEQYSLIANQKERYKEIEKLCKDENVNTAAQYIMTHSYKIKDKVQAFLFSKQIVVLLDFWICRRR